MMIIGGRRRGQKGEEATAAAVIPGQWHGSECSAFNLFSAPFTRGHHLPSP
jgi:hypothetical protein